MKCKLFFLLILFFQSFILSIEEFDAETVEMIDYNRKNNHIIFRGDIPRNNEMFAEEALKKAMEDAFHKWKKTNRNSKAEFPQKYTLCVLSLLTEEVPEEWDFVQIMHSFFSGEKKLHESIPKHKLVEGKKGEWIWWPVRAFVQSTPPLDPNISWKELKELFGNLSYDEVLKALVNQTYNNAKMQFPELVNKLYDLFYERTRYPRIIYIHSRYGINRTGALEAAYRMKCKNEDVESAWNRSVEKEEEYYEPEKTKAYLFYYKRLLEEKDSKVKENIFRYGASFFRNRL